jgi:hypothetical protein
MVSDSASLMLHSAGGTCQVSGKGRDESVTRSSIKSCLLGMAEMTRYDGPAALVFGIGPDENDIRASTHRSIGLVGLAAVLRVNGTLGFVRRWKLL